MPFDLDPYVDDGASTLTGPFARTYLDLNDDNAPNPLEEVDPGAGPYAFTPFDAGADDFCEPDALCGWDPDNRTSWMTNRNQAAVQAHYYVSRFHDHLEQPAIGFADSDGNFEEDDPVEVNANDGAATGPDLGHVDNANMSTPPDGEMPLMQMYLFEPLPQFGVLFRAINGDDSADILYHEYTHGLSNRLVVNDEGFGALSSSQAGAMGEAWSDWYAKDLLAREGFEIDDPGDGDVDMGTYTDGVPHALRFEALDCPVGGDADACRGGADADGDDEPDSGTGGFTYGDFGVVAGGPEVHSDGEIWAQTLWDLREALVDQDGSEEAGSDLAEQLVTDGMRMSPDEPTFLDMRNAILGADQAVNDGANTDLIWDVFAARGMGYFAAAVDGGDTAPVEDFSQPPAPGGPTGTITGTVTDGTSGLPVEGQRVGIAGHTSEIGFGDDFVDTTGSDGQYAITGVPAATYPKLAFFPAVGYDLVVNEDVTVPAGGTTVQDAVVRRDWAASSGGALIDSNDDEGAPFGCGHDQLIDQNQGVGWSPFQADAPVSEGNPHPGVAADGDDRAARADRRQRVRDGPRVHLRRRPVGDDAALPRGDVRRRRELRRGEGGRVHAVRRRAAEHGRARRQRDRREVRAAHAARADERGARRLGRAVHRLPRARGVRRGAQSAAAGRALRPAGPGRARPDVHAAGGVLRRRQRDHRLRLGPRRQRHRRPHDDGAGDDPRLRGARHVHAAGRREGLPRRLDQCVDQRGRRLHPAASASAPAADSARAQRPPGADAAGAGP